jgi:hypothetical protein
MRPLTKKQQRQQQRQEAAQQAKAKAAAKAAAAVAASNARMAVAAEAYKGVFAISGTTLYEVRLDSSKLGTGERKFLRQHML